MSEIICPHCGSPNPIEAFNCSVCHKSLYEEPSQPYQPAADNDMEWLKEFQPFGDDSGPDHPEETDSETAAEPERSSQEEIRSDDTSEMDIPEWLARIRARAKEELPPAETVIPQPLEKKFQVGQPITTDFLHELSASEEQTGTDEIKESFPEWLKRISARKQAGRDSEPEVEAGPFDETSEELGTKQGYAPEVEKEPSPFIDTDENVETPAPISSGLEEFTEFRELPPFESEPSLAIPPGDEDTDFGTDEDLTALDFPESQAAEQFEELPTFLKTPLSETPDGLDELPDFNWLDDRAVNTPPVEGSSEDSLESLDWLKLDGDQETSLSASSGADHAESQGELPGWLFTKPEEMSEDEINASIFGSAGSDEPVDAQLPGGAVEDLPDWLALDRSSRPSEDAVRDELTSQDNLAVPDWLVEIQGSETSAPQKTGNAVDERIEAVGPLAGYQGVLPGEEAVTHYTKPPVYSNTLQVTDKQRILSTIFDTLIAEELTAGEKPSARVLLSQQTLRLVVGILMIGLMIIALVFDANISVLPALYPPENVSFFNTIQSIKSTEAASPILIGIDYEPALAGEMRTVAAGVVKDLMAENRDIVFVSLNPTGPVLASDLIERSLSDVPDYQTSERVVNLGYLPGGGSALAGFAAAPQRAAPVTANGVRAWDSGALQEIRALSDFNAIILLTDSTESARTWIEQIKPFSGDSPVLLVSSAQAAPALQPYVQSGQVAGMISGLNGAAAYHQLSQNTDEPVNGYWDAFQGGMLIIAAFMLLGALAFGVKVLVTRVRKA